MQNRILLEVDCQKKSYPSQRQDLVAISLSLSLEEQEVHICVLETSSKESLLGTIYFFHKHYFLDKYAKLERKCCNPFKIHNEPMKNSSLRAITLDTYRKIKAKGMSLRVIPGKKLFANCNIKVGGMPEGNDSSCHTSSADSEIEDAQVQIQADQSLQEVNTSLEYLGESPLKFNGVPFSRKRIMPREKWIEQVTQFDQRFQRH